MIYFYFLRFSVFGVWKEKGKEKKGGGRERRNYHVPNYVEGSDLGGV